jgi:hypothetical protein
VRSEAKERNISEQYFLKGHSDEDKSAIWDAGWSLGTFEQDMER